MMIFTITATFIGALLGQRFKVFILVPAAAIGSAANFGIGMAHGNSLWSILLATVLAISALQMGYLGGSSSALSARGRRSEPIRAGL
jgi:hypothetical protein